MNELRSATEYQYSVRIPPGVTARVPEGETSTAEDGSTQVLLHEEDTFRVSKRLLDEGVRFSISPVSLDDIFLGLSQQVEEVVERGDEEKEK